MKKSLDNNLNYDMLSISKWGEIKKGIINQIPENKKPDAQREKKP